MIILKMNYVNDLYDFTVGNNENRFGPYSQIVDNMISGCSREPFIAGVLRGAEHRVDRHNDEAR